MVAFGLITLVICSCTSRNDDPQVSQGRNAFHARLCTSCHGAGCEGTPRGPRLEDLSLSYDEQALITFIRNPDTGLRNSDPPGERTRAFAAGMPSYGYLDTEELRSLAAFLLTLD